MTIRIAAAQTPEIREDVGAALDYLRRVADEAQAAGAALLCLPEAFLQGYLLEDTAARRHAVDLDSPALRALLARFPKEGPTIVVGLIELQGERLFNSAIVVRERALLGRYRKAHLLAHEHIFEPGTDADVFDVAGLRFGINICADANCPQAARRVAEQGASLIVCPANNMLPRRVAESWKDRHNAVRAERCRETGLWLVSADVTGERDGMAGWGPTALIDPTGRVAAELPLERPGLLVSDLPC
jgi:predicted amidohydrolase